MEISTVDKPNNDEKDGKTEMQETTVRLPRVFQSSKGVVAIAFYTQVYTGMQKQTNFKRKIYKHYYLNTIATTNKSL